MDDLCYDNRLNICEIEHKAGPFHTNTFLCPQAQPKAAKLVVQIMFFIEAKLWIFNRLVNKVDLCDC